MGDGPVIGSLGDLAAVPGLPSEPTLRKLIRDNPEFPIVSVGTNGRSYEIDVEAAVTWIKTHEEKLREAARARSVEARQFALELLGPDTVADSRTEGLSAVERRQLLEEELVRIKVSERRGELVRKSSVEAAFAAVFDLLNDQQRNLSARLAKRMDLSRQQQTIIDDMVARDLQALADKFEELGSQRVLPDGSDNTAV